MTDLAAGGKGAWNAADRKQKEREKDGWNATGEEQKKKKENFLKQHRKRADLWYNAKGHGAEESCPVPGRNKRKQYG